MKTLDSNLLSTVSGGMSRRAFQMQLLNSSLLDANRQTANAQATQLALLVWATRA
jgi:hypothetical protein